MILVDVEVPALGMSYDFELDEEAMVSELTEKIMSMVGEQEGVALEKEKDMLLAAFQGKLILEKGQSLSEQGVANGHRLILI